MQNGERSKKVAKKFKNCTSQKTEITQFNFSFYRTLAGANRVGKLTADKKGPEFKSSLHKFSD